MSNTIGRIALGVVGALIAGPAFAAIGFSIGSAIGGMLFAPDGPKTEGPRIGDTAVTSASLGKIIAQHYGITRSSGNVIWSTGLRETKTVEEVGGGGGKGGGGGSSTNTTYSYDATFAIAFGRAPARFLRRIWADSKLIYDASGVGTTSDAKYKFRFVEGGPGTTIDPLIEESVNRRLAGLDDINVGNQEQATYTTFADLIEQAELDGSARGIIYAARLQAIQAGVTGEVPDYGFTPSYKEFAYIVFDGMPLEDFGNRIPNITAEIEWDIAATDYSGSGPNLVNVPDLLTGEISTSLTGLDTTNRMLLTTSNTTLRRFNLSGAREDRNTATNLGSLERVLAANNHGSALVLGTVGTDNVLSIASIAGPTIISDPILWPGLDDGPLHAVRFPDQMYDEADPEGSKAKAYLVTNDERMIIVSDEFVRDEYTWPTDAAINKSGPFGIPYRQEDQPKLISVRFGDRSIELRKVYLQRVSGSTLTVAQMDYVEPENNQLQAILGLIGGGGQSSTDSGPLAFGVGIQSVRYALITPPEFATGPTIEGVSALRFDQFALPFRFESTGAFQGLSPLTAQVLGINPDVLNNPPQGGTGAGTDLVPYSMMIRMSDGTGRLYLHTGQIFTIPYPPTSISGINESITTFGTQILYASGRDLVRLDFRSGTFEVFPDLFTNNISADAQVYIGSVRALLVWDGTQPKLAYAGRPGAEGSQPLSAILESLCVRSGMDPDEYDVSEINPTDVVEGYSIARAANIRQTMENILLGFFVDGVETDWKVKFTPRNSTPIRTILDDELGTLDEEMSVNFAEQRTPEYDLGAEVNLNFIDPDRDYEQNSVPKRRIASPISVMDSRKQTNIEMPMVMRKSDAQALAERLLFQEWLSRDQARARLSWSHADLDPADVVAISLKDGRILTDRIQKITTGANFEAEIETVRSGDPIHVRSQAASITSASVPTQRITLPIPSTMYVFDIPLLNDFHDAGRAATRYYMAAATLASGWRSASFYRANGMTDYSLAGTTGSDVTWGSVIGVLPPPRAQWATDYESTIRIYMNTDKGDVVSITQDEMLAGGNYALIWDPRAGEGELIQFQTVTANSDGSITLSILHRGLRGTDYFVDRHRSGGLFFLLRDASIRSAIHDLSWIGTSARFKAVSAGEMVSQAQSITHRFVGRDIMPWAPSNLSRGVNGSAMTFTWNRRARLSGQWNTASTNGDVPLIEDFEQYEAYVIAAAGGAAFNPSDAATYLVRKVVTSSSTVVTAAELTAAGITLADPVILAVYQISARVGRGFKAQELLAP